jgi:hypothetical protein
MNKPWLPAHLAVKALEKGGQALAKPDGPHQLSIHADDLSALWNVAT